MLTREGQKSTIVRVECSSLVQSVERRTVNPYVAGSIPAGGATSPQRSSLVQSVERRTVNPYVAGSIPAGGATTP